MGRILEASSGVPLAELAASGRCRIRGESSVVMKQRAAESIACTCRSAACASFCGTLLLMPVAVELLGVCSP